MPLSEDVNLVQCVPWSTAVGEFVNKTCNKLKQSFVMFSFTSRTLKYIFFLFSVTLLVNQCFWRLPFTDDIGIWDIDVELRTLQPFYPPNRKLVWYQSVSSSSWHLSWHLVRVHLKMLKKHLKLGQVFLFTRKKQIKSNVRKWASTKAYKKYREKMRWLLTTISIIITKDNF